ncbi:MAG: ftsH [Rickettsiaceae bacterium]|jgi:cell division protease FtsH|nr:ftsH [Rickettsiaceae bacterium]
MNTGKNFFVWIVVLVLLVMSYDILQGSSGIGKAETIAFSDFLHDVDAGRVKQVSIRGSYIEGRYEDGAAFSTYSPNYPGMVDNLKAANVKIEAAPLDTTMSSLFSILVSWFPILLLVGVWIFFMRQMQGGGKGGGAMGFGRSRAKLMSDKGKKITFADVAGIEEAKEDLQEIVDFLQAPEKFSTLGGKIPKGCLLIGSPGTGKTLLAKAIAGEAGVPFFSISGSDFVEMFVGVGASRVRDLFEQGKKSAPCLIFIDEIDAVGRHRGAGLGGGNDEREQTLNQLLVEMDGFEENEGVIILAATNRPDVLDPALLRPGRFDRQIVVPLPDILGREKILNVHLQKVPMGPDVEAIVIARGTPGFTGADLANLVNEAALLAARKNRKVVTMHELEEAKDKVMMGAERKSMVVGEEERKLTAYHEAGHAIVSLHCPASDPIHKATIIPRGRALGMVMRLPEKDRLSLTREKAKADMAVAMGGRVAEEIIFGYEKVTSGASSDIKMATSMARSMVTEWGMSDKVGPIFHSANQEEVFLGHSVSQQKNLSEETANLIDQEVKGLVQEGYKRAEDILKKHMKDLEALAKALLEYETLTGDDITDILSDKKLKRLDIKPKGTIKKSSVPMGVVATPEAEAEEVVTESQETSAEKKLKKPAAPKPKKTGKPATDGKPASEGA